MIAESVQAGAAGADAPSVAARSPGRSTSTSPTTRSSGATVVSRPVAQDRRGGRDQPEQRAQPAAGAGDGVVLQALGDREQDRRAGRPRRPGRGRPRRSRRWSSACRRRSGRGAGCAARRARTSTRRPRRRPAQARDQQPGTAPNRSTSQATEQDGGDRGQLQLADLPELPGRTPSSVIASSSGPQQASAQLGSPSVARSWLEHARTQRSPVAR